MMNFIKIILPMVTLLFANLTLSYGSELMEYVEQINSLEAQQDWRAVQRLSHSLMKHSAQELKINDFVESLETHLETLFHETITETTSKSMGGVLLLGFEPLPFLATLLTGLYGHHKSTSQTTFVASNPDKASRSVQQIEKDRDELKSRINNYINSNQISISLYASAAVKYMLATAKLLEDQKRVDVAEVQKNLDVLEKFSFKGTHRISKCIEYRHLAYTDYDTHFGGGASAVKFLSFVFNAAVGGFGWHSDSVDHRAYSDRKCEQRTEEISIPMEDSSAPLVLVHLTDKLKKWTEYLQERLAFTVTATPSSCYSNAMCD